MGMHTVIGLLPLVALGAVYAAAIGGTCLFYLTDRSWRLLVSGCVLTVLLGFAASLALLSKYPERVQRVHDDDRDVATFRRALEDMSLRIRGPVELKPNVEEALLRSVEQGTRHDADSSFAAQYETIRDAVSEALQFTPIRGSVEINPSLEEALLKLVDIDARRGTESDATAQVQKNAIRDTVTGVLQSTAQERGNVIAEAVSQALHSRPITVWSPYGGADWMQGAAVVLLLLIYLAVVALAVPRWVGVLGILASIATIIALIPTLWDWWNRPELPRVTPQTINVTIGTAPDTPQTTPQPIHGTLPLLVGPIPITAFEDAAADSTDGVRQAVCTARQQLAREGATAALVLGRHDRRPLSVEAQKKFASNAELAEARARTIAQLLSDRKQCDGTAIVSSVVELSVSPRFTHMNASNRQMEHDRQVEIIGFGTQKPTSTEAYPGGEEGQGTNDPANAESGRSTGELSRRSVVPRNGDRALEMAANEH